MNCWCVTIKVPGMIRQGMYAIVKRFMSLPDKTQRNGPGNSPAGHLVTFVLILVLPGIALYRLVMRVASMRQTTGWHVPEAALGYLLLISAATYFVYYGDKKKARAEEWRTPETIMHFMEMAGGWPGAFIAQRLLRHKISKRSYQWAFWVIIVVYQFAASEVLSGWMISRKLVELVQRQLE